MNYPAVAERNAYPRLETAPRAAADVAPRRIAEFDVMRGLAIILVVYMHAYFSPWSGTPHEEVFAMHFIHLFGHTAVPVFFFVSAFLLSRDRTPTYREFLSKKVRGIYAPLGFWMLAVLAYRIWENGGHMTPALWKALVLFDVAGQYYFLAVLVLFMGSFYFLRNAPETALRRVAILAFGASLGAILFYELSGISDTYAYRNPAVWVFFYAFGFYAGHRWQSLEPLSAFLKPGLAAMACVMAAYVVQGELLGGYPVSYFGVTVFLFGCASLVVYPGLVLQARRSLAGERLMAPFARLSRYAFAIYLVHMPFFIGRLTDVVLPNGAFEDDYFKRMMAVFLVGFAGTLAFAVAVARVAPRVASDLLAIEPARS